jgi:cytochrome c-type biogenesis protein CcmH
MRFTRIRVLAACALLALSARLLAGEAQPASEDPVLEARVMKLAAELRCLVCQNQSLADSHADLALDLKNQVREQMRSGKSDAEIRAYLVARYGDFVLYNPPLKPATWLLWVGPFVLMAAGAGGLALYLRRRRSRIGETELSPDDRARVRALLDTDAKGGRG